MAEDDRMGFGDAVRQCLRALFPSPQVGKSRPQSSPEGESRQARPQGQRLTARRDSVTAKH